MRRSIRLQPKWQRAVKRTSTAYAYCLRPATPCPFETDLGTIQWVRKRYACATIPMTINSANIGRFAEFFHCLSVKIDGAYYRDVHGALILPAIVRYWENCHLSTGQCPSSSSTPNYSHVETGDSCVYPTRFVASQQSGPEPAWLQNLGRNAGTCVSIRPRWESRSDAVFSSDGWAFRISW